MATVSLREAARQLTQKGHPVSHVALHHQIKRGAIPVEVDGTLDMGKLMASEWMRARLAKSGASLLPVAVLPVAPVIEAAKPEPSPSRPAATQIPLGDSETSEPSISADPSDMQSVLALPKIDIEKLKLAEQWRRQRLENDERDKNLVRANEVEGHVESRFRDEAQALLNWPSTISKQMAADLGVDDQLMLVILEKYVREYMQERSSVPVAGLAA